MKNKIHKYDFLVVGAGLIGSIAALALIKKKLKVLVVDKENKMAKDNRTLAVNANSIDFLKQLDIWDKLKSKPQPIEKIVIGDYINNYPLIFENKDETMGNVIFNREVHQLAKKKLKNLNVLITDKNFNSSKIIPNEKYTINKKNYVFKKVIISIGKKIISNPNHESIIFEQKHNSYVGFFKHTKDHNNTAYEFFTNKGPLAILPAPSLDKKMSTFIYSSKEKANNYNLQNLIKKKIEKFHGKLFFNKSISKFPITPHLTKNNKNFIYVGDSLKSIHPVAGQGWNLGVKDIQTLCKLLDRYSLEAKNFNSIYYSRRIFEGTIYLSFTSLLNYLYETKNNKNIHIIKSGYNFLRNAKFVRDIFIRQAMGRISLID